MSVSGHISRNTPLEHIDTFYKDFDEIRGQNYGRHDYHRCSRRKSTVRGGRLLERVGRDFSTGRTNTSPLLSIFVGLLWPGLYHFYGIPKYPLDKKLFGVFAHHKYDERNPIFRGFDDLFYVPHSRYSEVRRADIEKDKSLNNPFRSEDAGVYMVMARCGREFFITGHSEYSTLTLDIEYRRDFGERPRHCPPRNYDPDNNPDKQSDRQLAGHATCFSRIG